MNREEQQPILLRRATSAVPLARRPALHPVAGLQALRFAQHLLASKEHWGRIATRSGRLAAGGWTPLERVWLARWPGLEAAPTLQTLRLQVAPRLNLALFHQTTVEQSLSAQGRTQSTSAGPVVGSKPGILPRPRLSMPTGMLQQMLVRHQQYIVLPVEELVERLVARGERLEPHLHAEPNLDEPPGRPLPVPPPLRLLPRMAVQPGAQAAPASLESIPPAFRRPEVPTRPGPEELLADIDVNRLTDQVIQAIDRRVIAQRERLGLPGGVPGRGRS